MIVACFCGVGFELAGDHGTCPLCGEPVSLPPNIVAEQMEAELHALLEAHNPSPKGS